MGQFVAWRSGSAQPSGRRPLVAPAWSERPSEASRTTAPTEKDQDTTEVSLKKGMNVLVVKVVNEKIDWSFCVRFTDKDDQPVKGLAAGAGE